MPEKKKKGRRGDKFASRTAKQPSPQPNVQKPETPAEDAVPGDGGKLIVVGIGASAGGLEAFKKFFGALPADSGLAFVLIPHLDPEHESLMVELLARCTTMPVIEAADNMSVEADRVYILPPNKYMTIQRRKLRLTGPVKRRGIQTSIDVFLRSLAEDCGEKAVGIILSGTGTHGTLGLKAIKENGGMAMVQDPATAAFDSMPASAAATGLMDYCLPPEQMPAALANYIHRYFLDGDRSGKAAAELAQQMHLILALLRLRTKHDFRCYRKKMIMRRIERRMGLINVDRLSEYLVYLRQHDEEIHRLVGDLLISVTSFFRDPEAFRILETQVIPHLLQAKDGDVSVRIWVPACATGEEAYSLAILFLEQLTATQKNCRLQVFATDVDEKALDIGRRGVYLDAIAADVSPERLSRFFAREGEHSYRVSKVLREAVVFASQNLLNDAPFSKMDLISCRNLLIYLEADVQKKIIPVLHFALNDNGYLFLGPSETTGQLDDLFDPVSKKWRIHRRIGLSRPERIDLPVVFRETPKASGAPQLPATARPFDVGELAKQLLLQNYAPAAVLINRKFEVLFFFGPTMRYLDQPTGEPTKDLFVLSRDGLRSKLRAAVNKAVVEPKQTVMMNARIKRDGGYSSVQITVRPVNVPPVAEGLFLVAFTDVAEPEGLRPPVLESEADDLLVRQLENELSVTREDLQGSIEELEGSNEQLKALNEEVMSMNEELQSANEELETSKEELQSLNEEMNTVNSQLHDKVEDLERANNDMANLMSSTDIATLFLDASFRIKSFTPATTKLLNLIPTDVGRPLADIAPKFADRDLMRDAERVLHHLVPLEHEVGTHDGSWYIRRIVPYRTLDDRIEGVVITFADVTFMKKAAEHQRRLATVLIDSNDAVTVFDFDGQITSWNRGASALYGYSEAEALAMNVIQLVPPERHARTRALFDRLRAGENVQSWDTQRVCKDGAVLDIWLKVTTLSDESGKPVAIATTERDVTERNWNEQVLRKSEETARQQLAEIEAIYTTAPVGLAFIDAEMHFVRINEQFARLDGLPVSAHLGRAIGDVIPNLAKTIQEIIRQVIESGEPRLNVEIQFVAPAQPTLARDWLLSLYPLKKSDGLLRGVSAVVVDVTERKRIEQEVLALNDRLETRVAERTAQLEHANQALLVEIAERKRAQGMASHLAAIVEYSDDSIVGMTTDGTITSWNAGAQRIYGYAPDEVIGRSIFSLMLPANVDELKKIHERVRRGGDVRNLEITRIRKDGREVVVSLTNSPIRNAAGEVVGISSIGRDVSERIALEKEVLEIAAQEQSRIGQDLHDSVGQELTGLGLMAEDLLETLTARSSPEMELGVKIVKGLQRALAQVRTLSRGLVPVEVDAEGLMVALADLARRITEQSGVECSFICEQPCSVENNFTATHLYRIAQEAVTNALKHSGTHHIRIILHAAAGQIVLKIVDDGTGIADQNAANSGMGLRIMKYRAGLINALMNIDSVEGNGTEVICTLTKEEPTDGQDENDR